MKKYSRDREVISTLSPDQYRVTQESDTERPGTGAYLHNKEPGIYVDIVSGEPLFASSDDPRVLYATLDSCRIAI